MHEIQSNVHFTIIFDNIDIEKQKDPLTSQAAAVTSEEVSGEKAGLRAAPTCAWYCSNITQPGNSGSGTLAKRLMISYQQNKIKGQCSVQLSQRPKLSMHHKIKHREQKTVKVLVINQGMLRKLVPYLQCRHAGKSQLITI